jgi:hypothetical protein
VSSLLFCSGPRDRGGASALFEPRLLRAPHQTWATFPSPRLIDSARAPSFPGTYWRIGGFGDNLQELQVQENRHKVVLGKQSWPWERCGNDSRPSAPWSQGCSPTIITQRINVPPVKTLVPHSILTSSRNRQLAMVLHTRITWVFFFLLLP